MEHQISVDEEVFDALVQHRQGFEQPNDVLRRLLLGDPPARPETFKLSKSRTGRLAPLLAAGLLEAGDELRHERVRKGQVFTAIVTSEGMLQTSEGVYSAPSPALKTLVGTEVDGWHNWVHVRSGKTLRELRESSSSANPRT
ncbi:hypothetical protein ACFYTQ_20490 [Nocardia sp. NPDC004068]|uniref:restriction system modified-DNA reader domain-containing protein n=1 Tax=Nocardia sp. NPDC004068 TaxID=3364303 RepID=UPI0036B2FAFF